MALGLHALAAEDYLSKKEPNGRRFHSAKNVLCACCFRLVMSSLASVVRLRFSSMSSCLNSFIMIVKRKSIVIAPAPSLMTCQFRRVRRKKSDIRVAIYYFDFMCRDGAEIDRGTALLITLLSMALLYSVLLFGRCYVCC